MSRYKPLAEHTPGDRNELRRIMQNPLADPDLTIRAKAILLFLDGMKGDAIARELHVRPNTVSDWRKRYETNGIKGLYDKAPKGRRGSSTRDRVLELLETQPPEGSWSTKSLAEAAGTSQDTVRRALRDEHISLSKSCVWDKEIPRSPIGVCVSAIGLYMAKEEVGLVLEINSEMGSRSPGHITTRNRSLADSLDQMEGSGKALSLNDAISVATQHMKPVSYGKREDFQTFAGKLMKDHRPHHVNHNVTHYYIIYWHEGNSEVKPILQHAGVMVGTATDLTDWFSKVGPWLMIMSSVAESASGEDADSLLASMQRFMSKATPSTEAFIWRRTPIIVR